MQDGFPHNAKLAQWLFQRLHDLDNISGFQYLNYNSPSQLLPVAVRAETLPLHLCLQKTTIMTYGSPLDW